MHSYRTCAGLARDLYCNKIALLVCILIFSKKQNLICQLKEIVIYNIAVTLLSQDRKDKNGGMYVYVCVCVCMYFIVAR